MQRPDRPEEPGSAGPMRFVGLGIQLAASLVVCVLIGQWVDRKLGTGGLATIAGAFVGFAGTLMSLLRLLKRKDDGGPGGRGRQGSRGLEGRGRSGEE